jgi:hypothetical protein
MTEDRDAVLDLIIARLQHGERLMREGARTFGKIRDRARPQMVARIVDRYQQIAVVLQAAIEKLRQAPGNPDAPKIPRENKERITKDPQ